MTKNDYRELMFGKLEPRTPENVEYLEFADDTSCGQHDTKNIVEVTKTTPYSLKVESSSPENDNNDGNNPDGDGEEQKCFDLDVYVASLRPNVAKNPFALLVMDSSTITIEDCCVAVSEEPVTIRLVPENYIAATLNHFRYDPDKLTRIINYLPEKYMKYVDKPMLLSVLAKDGSIYRKLGNMLQHDIDICKAALTNDGRIYGYIPLALRNIDSDSTRELKMLAVQQCGTALQYINGYGNLGKDAYIWYMHLFETAIIQDAHALNHVPIKYITRELVDTALKYHSDAYGDADVFSAIPMCLLTTEICLRFVEKNGLLLDAVPPMLVTRSMCLAGIHDNAYAMEFVPRHFLDEEFFLDAINNNENVLPLIPDDMITMNMCEAAIHHGGSLWGVPERLRTRELCYLASQYNRDFSPWQYLDFTRA